jgi:aspartyl aminopeptidase
VTPGGHYIVRGGAVVAWQIPAGVDAATAGFRIVGSHTDSPGLKLKPRGDIDGPAGWKQAGVEIYGGAILDSWLDRELRLAGRIVLADGTEQLVATGPVLRVPHLAIHLDRKVNSDPALDRQAHLQPVFAVGEGAPEVLDVVASAAGVAAADIVAHDLITVDAQHGEIFGARGDFLAAGRMDNLSSVFTSLEALLAAGDSRDIRVLAAFDHEEVGSATTSGAAGPVLEDILVRIAAGLGADIAATRAMYARSTCASADAAHSVHPNYAGKHDAVNRPVMNGGPVLKVNANQRYATDAVTAAAWRRACAAAGVPDQVFAGNNDVPCGSTIGPITATRLGIPTVDVGIPLLSMHSAREMAGVADLAWFAAALQAWWEL